MTKTKQLKTRDELIASGERMYRAMPQYRDKLLSGVMTDEDLYIMAANWADKQLREREARRAGEYETRKAADSDDEEYRISQGKNYREAFEWNNANDEASLESLLNLEVQIRQIIRELNDPVNKDLKKELRKSLADTVKEHRFLQKDLGIDKTTRSKAESAKSTIDDWERIKRDAKRKMTELVTEFKSAAAECKDEAELRDRIKYHGLVPFEMVDLILSNHRRVLGLAMEVEKS